MLMNQQNPTTARFFSRLLEVLLSSEIEKALVANDTSRLTELSKTGGFTSILHDVISKRSWAWAAASPATYFDTLHTLNTLDIDDPITVEHIWHDATDAASRLAEPFIPTDPSRSGMIALLGHCSAQRKALIAEAILGSLTADRDMPSAANSFGTAWFLLVESLIDGSRDIDRDDHVRLFSDIPIYRNIEFLLAVAEQASESQTITLRSFNVLNTADDVSKALIAMSEQSEPPERLRSITSAFLEAPQVVNWNTYVVTIKHRLQQNSPVLNSRGAKRLLQLLSDISNSQKLAKDAIEEMTGDGTLQGVIQLGLNEGDFELAAIAIDKLIDFKKAKWEGPAEHVHYGQLADINSTLNTLQSNPKSNPELVS
jgi:hypothetical protein